MGGIGVWQQLLETERYVAPWWGRRSVRTWDGRGWRIDGPLPPEHGWYAFTVAGRVSARWELVDPPDGVLRACIRGYLVGNRLVPDDAPVRALTKTENVGRFESVYLLEEGLDRFARITAGRYCSDGPLIFESQAMPLGVEDDVLQAYLDKEKSLSHLKGVTPALDMAFRFESWHREQVEKQRLDEERRQREEQLRLEREDRTRRLVSQLGDGAGRRQMAAVDFGQAARAALAVGGAEYLDHRTAYGTEIAVRFRLNRRRFECTCDVRTLRVLDAGICLTDEATGRKDDRLLTLESLPAVILEAERTNRLVVFRHV